ncbi:MAG: glycoside hydrolase family 125 protein [Candidatus Sumerlaeia bacterium]|nr:glycoside hydrolase family 125 protein [Candidatus Sumerlaeia bacterium]
MTNYIPTGNEYIALPTVRERDAAVESVNVVLAKLDGLLEIEGRGGRPFLVCEGAAREAGEWRWDFAEDWVPRFRHARDERLGGLLCAPPDQRFVIYRAPEQRARFTLSVGRLFQTINVRHELPDWTCRVAPFNWSWTPGVVVDFFAGGLLLSMSLRSPGGARFRLLAPDGAASDLADGAAAFETREGFEIEIECLGEPDLVLGFGLSRVGARSADLEAGRVAADQWIARTLDWLAARAVSAPGDEALTRAANRNGHFARFYAMARTLDTSEAVSMTSRSHRYYVSAAYWDRDSLLWLYPFLVRNDAGWAAELLGYAFGPQLRHAGIHSRQIGGQVLEYGFELDELCAPLIAAGEWMRLYPEEPLFDDAPFARALLELLQRLKSWRVERLGLYETELMPTDDLIVEGRGVLSYNNALVLRALRLLLPWAERHAPSQSAWMRRDIDEIPRAVRRHLVRDGVFQWAVDAEGNAEFYDEAAGSLLLLPYHGLCAADDPAYLATVSRLYSEAYPYRLAGPFSELGNRHTEGRPHPWVLSACNSALSGVRRSEGLDFLRRARMDNGVACESVNVETGLPETGHHFATCAGFVAHAIAVGAGAPDAPEEGRLLEEAARP